MPSKVNSAELSLREEGAEERDFDKLPQEKPHWMRTNFYEEMIYPSLNESGTSIGKEALSHANLRLVWPTVDKPRTVAVRRGPGGLCSCWEGEGCGLSSDDNHDLV